MRFDLTFKSDDHLNLYLKHLGLSNEGPSLSYLNRLIYAHKHNVPFETFTRILDYHSHPDSLMTIPEFIERLEKGCGGVCWTLARGFHWLLKNLGFETQYYYMEPGHVCVVVKFPEGEFYADVGYAAPFFRAWPLRESFVVKSEFEVFDYQVKGDEVLVTRTPGPIKTLILKPQSPLEINSFFEKMNVPGSKFLTTATINLYFEEKLLRITGNKLIGHGPEREITDDEVSELLTNRFRISPSFYLKARARIG